MQKKKKKNWTPKQNAFFVDLPVVLNTYFFMLAMINNNITTSYILDPGLDKKGVLQSTLFLKNTPRVP